MSFLKVLFFSCFLFFNLHCTHSPQSLKRDPSTLATNGGCTDTLGALTIKTNRSQLGLANDSSTETTILPPAEIKTLEPLDPNKFSVFSHEKKLTLSTYNVLNLKTSVGKFEPDLASGKRVKTKPEGPKSEQSIEGVAQAIKEISPDIIFLQEVEGEESLITFAKEKLNNEWRPLYIKGNDSRGIQIGVLVKNSIPLHFEYESHRDEPFSSESHPNLKKVFSRDFPVLLAKSPSAGDPLFILCGVHGKSKRSENTLDPESREIRTAQAERMVAIIKSYQNRYPKSPLLVLGDFNAEVNSEPEYEALRHFNLKDAFDLSPNPLPKGDPGRITHTYHPKDGATKRAQLDSILVAPPFQNLILGTHVYRYKNADGSEIPLPSTYGEREQNPSDHYPVWTELNLQQLLKIN